VGGAQPLTVAGLNQAACAKIARKRSWARAPDGISLPKVALWSYSIKTSAHPPLLAPHPTEEFSGSSISPPDNKT
jgi:hypothetical protein